MGRNGGRTAVAGGVAGAPPARHGSPGGGRTVAAPASEDAGRAPSCRAQPGSQAGRSRLRIPRGKRGGEDLSWRGGPRTAGGSLRGDGAEDVDTSGAGGGEEGGGANGE